MKQLDASKHLVETKMKEIDKLWESGYWGIMKDIAHDRTDVCEWYAPTYAT